jgi:hypothetical protein
MQFRPRDLNSSDVAEITLMNPGDILVWRLAPYNRGARLGEKLTMALSLRTEFYAINN